MHTVKSADTPSANVTTPSDSVARRATFDNLRLAAEQGFTPIIARIEFQNRGSVHEGSRVPPERAGYRTGPPACAKSHAKTQSGGGEQAGEMAGRREKRKKLRVAVFHGKQEMQVARARVSRTGKLSGFTTPTSRALGTVQSTLGVGGCGRDICATVDLSLQRVRPTFVTRSELSAGQWPKSIASTSAYSCCMPPREVKEGWQNFTT
jgi:hypothetical protein